MKTVNIDDVYVRLQVRHPYMSDKQKAIAQKVRDAEHVVEQIKRHVDDVFDVEVVREYKGTCSHCGSRWTEDDPNYNGGCCHEDQDQYELSIKQGVTQ